jgi:Zn-dependent protease
MFFLLFAAFALFLGWNADNSTAGDANQHAGLTLAAISLAILFVSVLLHEIGHLQTAAFFGGSLDDMVLAPLGGLTSLRPPRNPRHEVFAHLAGPLVNLILALICIAPLTAFAPASGGSSVPWGLLNPLEPYGITGKPEQLSWDCLRLGAWINWMLAVVNLLPTFPFDGGRALRAGISVLWRRGGRQQAAQAVSRLAIIVAAALLIAAMCLAVFQGSDIGLGGPRIVPVWFALAMLGIFLLFSARLEEEHWTGGDEDEERLFDYDFSAGYTSLERSTESPETDDMESGPFSQWLEERKAARQRRQREKEQEDELRVDEILIRLHAQGMSSLSPDDKALLQRVSARYRSRQGNKA